MRKKREAAQTFLDGDSSHIFMPTSLKTKAHIASTILFAPGFFDAVAGRVTLQRVTRRQDNTSGQTSSFNGKRTWVALKGALHVHSDYSDGAGTIPQIMEAAQAAGVDFVLLSDHNTNQPAQDGWEEQYSQTPLLVTSTELTLNPRSYLMALDMPTDWDPVVKMAPQAAIDDINHRGGFSVVCLPFDMKSSWEHWDAEGYAGFEVINFSTIARRHLNPVSLFWISRRYKKHGCCAALRSLATRPDRELALWDRLTRSGRRMVGIASLDAHAVLKIWGRTYPIPSYEDAFRTLTTQVLIPGATGSEPHSRREILEAMRAGRCFMVYECNGDAREFSFGAEAWRGEAVMGETLESSGMVRFRASAPKQCLMKLLRNGRVVAASDTGRLEHEDNEPGAYRVEAYTYRKKIGPLYLGVRSWIFSNPIYIQRPALEVQTNGPLFRRTAAPRPDQTPRNAGITPR